MQAAVNLRAMMAARLIEDTRPKLDPSSFGVIRPEVEAADARQRNCCGTHRTGLKCYIQIAIDEPLTAQHTACSADCQHFRMRRWIIAADCLIAAVGHDAARARIDDDGSDRHLAAMRRNLGAGQRHFHIIYNFIVHSAQSQASFVPSRVRNIGNLLMPRNGRLSSAPEQTKRSYENS